MTDPPFGNTPIALERLLSSLLTRSMWLDVRINLRMHSGKQKTDNPAFNWLMNIKHINDVKAKLIVDNLQLETLEDVLNITNNDLQKINGIGSKTAGIVMKSIKR